MADFILTFHNVSDAIFFDRMAEKLFSSKLITVPRFLSSSCGYAVEISGEERAFSEFLAEEAPDYHEVFLESQGEYLLFKPLL